jgi:acetyl-CoA C-acetyltransferase
MRRNEMRDVSIIESVQTPVAEHWETSLRHLAYHAIEAATDDAGTDDIQALFVGNMIAGEISHQEHLGALIADFAGLRGLEAVRIEAVDASVWRSSTAAYVAVASGLIETARRWR